MTYRETLAAFTETDLPNLDTAVLGALELYAATELPPLAPLAELQRPLVVGSGNALAAGRIMFADRDAIFADEGDYARIFETRRSAIDGVVIVSASGGKHAKGAAAFFAAHDLPTWLVTANPSAAAGALLDPSRVLVFPKNREPYTYNTSTYLGMILAATGEQAGDILAHLSGTIAPHVPRDLGSYRAFSAIVPPEFGEARAMFRTKFDELFGPKAAARAFTSEEVKHAKTVVRDSAELFITFGEPHLDHELKQLCVPLPAGAGYGAVMAIGYYLIGQIQKQHPPYFKDSIAAYVRRASDVFGETIPVIVE